MPENPVISNTSPIVGLWTLGHLHLLRDLYTEVLIPEEVQYEFLATEESSRKQALKNAPWIRTVKLTTPLDDTIYPNVIHRGEASVFDLAKERGARLVILDDSAKFHNSFHSTRHQTAKNTVVTQVHSIS